MPSPKRILVIKLKQPGDVLVSTPVLQALKEAMPAAEVSYLVPRGTEEMLADHPQLSGLYVLDRRQGSWSEALRLIRELRRQRFDLALELSGGDRGAFFAFMSGARERVGFARPRQPFWQCFGLFTKLLPLPPVKMHLVEHNLEAVRALGISPQNPRLQFFWNRTVEAQTAAWLEEQGLAPGGFVVMHPGAGWRFKCWTPTGYARVIEALMEDWGLPVVLTGSRAAHEQELLKEILAECRARPLNLAGRLTLKELGALIAKARFFFGMDSAPMHLAAAVATPAVALFGPSGVFNWGPWGEGHLVIQKDWDCVPCGKDGCEGSKVSRCLVEIDPAEVLARLSEWAANPAATRQGRFPRNFLSP
jgi:heptosyltransferase-3